MTSNPAQTIIHTGSGGTAGGDSLRIEQSRWTTYGGSRFYEYLTAIGWYDTGLHDAGEYWRVLEAYNSNCREDGSIVADIKVHKSRPDLQYSLFASWGQLSNRLIAEEEQFESIIWEMTDTYPLGKKILSISSAYWESKVFNEDGRVIYNAEDQDVQRGTVVRGSRKLKVSLKDDTLYLAKKVFGVMRVKYMAQYDLSQLRIYPRADGFFDPADRVSAYESYVFALFNDSFVLHEVELPDLSAVTCGTAYSSVTINGKPDGVSPAPRPTTWPQPEDPDYEPDPDDPDDDGPEGPPDTDNDGIPDPDDPYPYNPNNPTDPDDPESDPENKTVVINACTGEVISGG